MEPEGKSPSLRLSDKWHTKPIKIHSFPSRYNVNAFTTQTSIKLMIYFAVQLLHTFDLCWSWYQYLSWCGGGAV